ncbi:MAG: sporulation protein YqfD [Oscillospiraceae bacterium]|nr:sporulation protein YqfD [Oscillospiraceae bacterium]
MKHFLRETVLLRIEGASPERCLNRWSGADLSFWELRRESEFAFQCRAYAGQLPALTREADRAQCRLELLGRSGLPLLLRRLRGRPVLLLGLPAALLLAFWLNSFVWFIRVEGNRRVPDSRILHALEEEGVRFGAWAPGLDSEDLKNRMLNRVPELRWLAVNSSGGVVTVLTAEREQEEPPLERGGVAHLIAARPGLIRELRVVNGFAVKAAGDPVQTGDILISGLMEWSTHTQATRAMGEVYAETFRAESMICPDTALEKVYTGRSARCKTLIFQRNRRKLSGNSSIFGTMCDRMIETRTWTLPGGWQLPIQLETETLLEYELRPAALAQPEAEAILTGEARRLTEAAMTAGQIESQSSAIQKKTDSYLCRVSMNCVEMIARTLPVELFGEDDSHGKTHQRGAD